MFGLHLFVSKFRPKKLPVAMESSMPPSVSKSAKESEPLVLINASRQLQFMINNSVLISKGATLFLN